MRCHPMMLTVLLSIPLAVTAQDGKPALKTAEYEALFLEADDLPKDLKKVQDGRSKGADKRDKNFPKYQGQQAGMVVWATGGQTSAMSRIVDIRWVFPDADSAKKYVNESLDYLSEGTPAAKEFPKVGDDCHVFGPVNEKVTKALGIEIRAYVYAFRHENVVVKLFVMQGVESKEQLEPKAIVPLAQAIVKRIAARRN